MTTNTHAYTDSQLFKMGAAVAIAELYAMGRLGSQMQEVRETQNYLAGFGITGMQDVVDLGIKGPYLEDFEEIYADQQVTTTPH